MKRLLVYMFCVMLSLTACESAVAGAGMGEYNLEFIDLIKNAKIPIVISSRVGSGIIDPNSLLNDNAVSAINLPPQKAAVLLRLCLTSNKTIDEMRRIFLEY